jgi:hypothetical protein
LYQTQATIVRNLPVGCPSGFNCVPYDPRCNVNPCYYPLGFCLPAIN